MKTLKFEVVIPFTVGVFKDGQLIAQKGDTIEVLERDYENHFIVKVGARPVYNTWMRKMWIKSHCNLPDLGKITLPIVVKH